MISICVNYCLRFCLVLFICFVYISVLFFPPSSSVSCAREFRERGLLPIYPIFLAISDVLCPAPPLPGFSLPRISSPR